MFRIIDENKKIILSDTNYTRLRTTALLLANEIEQKVVPMFTEENVDEAIIEVSKSDTDNLEI